MGPYGFPYVPGTTPQVLNYRTQSQVRSDLSDEALVLTAGVWLKPYLSGVRSKADLARLDWQASTTGMDPSLAHARVWALVVAVSAVRITV